MRITRDLMLHVGLTVHNMAVSAKLPANTFVKSVREICGHYSTTNEAVAAWPAFEYLLAGYVHQQDLIFEGTPKALPDGVDIAELTAMVTRAKLEV